MSVTRFPRAPLRAIYVAPDPRGGWFCYVAGYRPVARGTPTVSRRSFPTRAEAEASAAGFRKRVGLPLARTVSGAA